MFVSKATSIDVECVFSCGRLLLSHVCSRLSTQSVCALICLGVWRLMGMVKVGDVEAVAMMADIEGEEEEFEEG